MWALCRREHRLTWPEFQSLTLAEFEALEERRDLELRHARFNAALVVSAIFNVQLPPDTEAMSPFDLLPGFDDDGERERRKRRKAIKQEMYHAMTRLEDCKGVAPEQILTVRNRIIAAARAEGFEDAEDIYREVFPD